MIQANVQFARAFIRNDIPSIFVSQPPPEDAEIDTASEDRPRHTLSRFESAGIIRTLRRSEMSTFPSAHYSLGAGVYTQMTSPIRRYIDLIAQRQFMSMYADQKPFYQKEQLQTIIRDAADITSRIKQCEKYIQRYWQYRYLEQSGSEPHQGLVVRSIQRDILVELDICGLIIRMPNEHDIQPSNAIWVTATEANPRRSTALFQRADSPPS